MNVIEAVKSVSKGREVPHYCYHPKLTVAGNCRMCMVELGMPMRDRATEAILEADGSPKISWMQSPRLAVPVTLIRAYIKPNRRLWRLRVMG